MTPEKQRIAIAEACGYVWYRLPKHPNGERRSRFLAHPAIHEYEGQSEAWLEKADGAERIANWEFIEREGYVPNYLEDLNAMAEAEKTVIPEDLKLEYITQLAKVLGRKEGFNPICMATAPQRAEAILRTIGKWEEK